MDGAQLLLKCTKEFTTRESGIPFTVMAGTVWFKRSFDIAPGGYELTVLEQVNGGAFTGVCAKVRDERVTECFESVPLRECPEPVEVGNGCCNGDCNGNCNC